MIILLVVFFNISRIIPSKLCAQGLFTDLMERLECAKENLTCKSNELEEIQQISDTQQERIFELETELSNFRAGKVDHGKYLFMFVKCKFKK